MQDIKTQAITIGYVNYKEYDRILTLFSPEKGVFTATAYAVRRGKSEIRACADMFFYGEFVLRQNNKGYLAVKSIDMIDSFYDLRMDINMLSCASYLCDFINSTALKEYEQSEYFLLLIRSLKALCHDKADYRVVKLKFEMSAMEYLGYGAAYDKCSSCGNDIEKTAFFSASAGGVVCGSCTHDISGESINPRELATLNQINNMPIDSLSVIKINDEVFEKVNRVYKKYMFWHIERTFKSAAFLEKNYGFIINKKAPFKKEQ